MTRFFVVLAAILSANAAAAQPLDLEAIAKQPGTEVTKKMVNGQQIVTIKRGSVTVTIDKDRETDMDASGQAVLCFWKLAVTVKIATDLCYPGEFPQLSAMLGQYIEEANNFIVANNLRPVTKAEIEKSISDRSARAAAGIKAAGVPPAQNATCKTAREDDILPLNAGLEKYRQEFKQTLAVPRPPAFNPCY